MWAVYNEALEEECDSTVNSTVMWTHIQFDANSFSTRLRVMFNASYCWSENWIME